MIIPVATTDLPSGGMLQPGSEKTVYDIHPITFKQLLKYEQYPTNSFVQRIRRDILLLKDDIPDLSKVSFFDLDALVFLKKICSISASPQVRMTTVCGHCGATSTVSINLDDMTYKNLSKEILNIEYVDINNKRYAVRIPTVDYALKVVETFHQHKEIISPKILYLCCVLGFNENFAVKTDLENSYLEGIVLIDTLYKLLSGAAKIATFECQSCHQKGEVDVYNTSTDMFYDVKLNIGVPTKNIVFKTGVPSRP